MKDILLVTPPFTQLNTPYPATNYLKGFLNTINISSFQMDLGIEVILFLFSKKGLEGLFQYAFKNESVTSSNAKRILALKQDYEKTIDDIIEFLQGENQTFARQICTENFLPQASRFDQVDDLEWAFGTMGLQDKAKHLATLYLEDLSDFIIECVDENFGFSRYAERLGRSANSFDKMYEQLQKGNTYVDDIAISILDERVKSVRPKLVCFSVPFPGNLYSAFRCTQYIKAKFPNIKTVMGGGFPNTELRSLKDPRVFDYFDFITLDDGELPMELLISNINDQKEKKLLKRTYSLENGKVVFHNNSQKKDYAQNEIGTPDYSDLFLDKYISVIEVANPMHSLWSDGRWNKLTMAHGCYWGKCTFCDVSLDYIKNYKPVAAKLLVDRIEQLIDQSGEKGFHFVDEAAPPALMRDVAIEIIRRNLTITWWTNIRFEKSFTIDLCRLLKASGCIAVSGGLEVASNRLLNLIKKGVTVEKVAQVTRNFSEAGIMVHSYLMYGFPSQTVQETIDSLEMVRQLFELGIIQSGFWHQFALTAHSPVGLNPNGFGIIPDIKDISFADNDIQFNDNTGIDHNAFSFGLKKSLFNFMHGIGFELPLQNWFEFNIPNTQIHPDYIEQRLDNEAYQMTKPTARILWLGNLPLFSQSGKKRKGKSTVLMTFHDNSDRIELELEEEKSRWLLKNLDSLTPSDEELTTFATLKESYESQFDDFELFWYAKPMEELKENGLLVL